MAEPPLSVRLPALIVRMPEFELAPERTSVAEPFLVKAPEPLIEPAKVASEDWLAVRVWPATIEMLPPEAPPPESDPMVSEEAMWRIAPTVLDRTTGPLSAAAEPPVRVRLPALRTRPPEFDPTPERVSVAEPFLVKAPEPTMAPAKVAPEV